MFRSNVNNNVRGVEDKQKIVIVIVIVNTTSYIAPLVASHF